MTEETKEKLKVLYAGQGIVPGSQGLHILLKDYLRGLARVDVSSVGRDAIGAVAIDIQDHPADPYNLIIIDDKVGCRGMSNVDFPPPISKSSKERKSDLYAVNVLYRVMSRIPTLYQNAGVKVPPILLYAAQQNPECAVQSGVPEELEKLLHHKVQRLGGLGLILRSFVTFDPADAEVRPFFQNILIPLVQGNRVPLQEYFRRTFGQDTVPPFGGEASFGTPNPDYDGLFLDPQTPTGSA